MKNMRGLGLDFERLEVAGKFRFLKMAPLKEVGVPATIEQILGEVAEEYLLALHAKLIDVMVGNEEVDVERF